MLINILASAVEAPGFDWSPYVVVGIPGLIALVAVIGGKFFDFRNARRTEQETGNLRKEPTWPELVTENRDLREELDKLRDSFDEYREAQKDAKKEQDKKIEGLEIGQRLADRREVLLYQYTRSMRDHILNELPPPPPTPHPELVEWFAAFEDTQPSHS